MTQELTVSQRRDLTNVAERAHASIDLARRTLLPDGDDLQFDYFLAFGRAVDLDPFAKEYYGMIIRGKLVIVIGIDGYRKIAQRTGEFDSEDGPYWCGPDGEWRDVWLRDEPPSAAKVGVRRKGSAFPTYHTVKWTEYVRKGKDGQPTEMWRDMPANQLAKCAEAGALRKSCQAMSKYLAEVERTFEGVDAGYEVGMVSTPRPPIDRPRAKEIEIVPADTRLVAAEEDSEWIDGATGEIVEGQAPLVDEGVPTNPDAATPEQLQQFWVDVRKMKFSDEAAHKYLKDEFHLDSSKDATKAQLDKVRGDLAAIRRNEQAAR